MTDNNADQDDFDPPLEEGAEDFGYEDESFGDEEFSDEPWEEGFEDEGGEIAADEQHEQPPKKKGGLFNIILIAAALLGGGAFVYLKVLAPQGSPLPQPAPIVDAPLAAPDEARQAALPIEPPPVPSMPAPAAAPDALLPTLTPDSPAAPVPALAPETASAPELFPAAEDIAAAAPDGAVQASAAPAPQQPVEVTTAPPMPAPIATPESAINNDNGFSANLPSVKDIMLTPPAPSGDAAAPAGALSAEVAKGIEQKLSVLLTRLDTLEGRITNLESGLHQVSSKISTPESRPAATPDLENINKALQTLERKVTGLEKAAPSAAAGVSDLSKVEQPTFVPAVPEVSQPVEKTVSAIDAPKAEPSVKSAVKTQQAPTATHSVSWVLRSAQPGAAMVVPKTGGDMRTVRVGDNLSGLGRIIAIEQRGSRWVVQGTQGTLTH